MAFQNGGRPTPTRSFSVVSAPGAAELQIAMRVSGDFTALAASLTPGSPAQLQGPFGDFVFDKRARRAVMLAGGVGITPFISMIRWAEATSWPGQLTLIYAVRDSADVPFLPELDDWARRGRLRVIYAVSGSGAEQLAAAGREVVTERINQAFLSKLVAANSRYYICGPAGFGKAMLDGLTALGVPPAATTTEAFGQTGSQHSRGIQLAVFSLTALAIAGGVGYLALKSMISQSGAGTSGSSTASPAANGGGAASSTNPAANSPAATPYQTPTTGAS